MDVDALMDSMRAELKELNQPTATWRRVPMPPGGPGDVATASGETAVVTDTFEVLLITPGTAATAITARHAEAIEQAATRWGLESLTPETVAAALCAEIIETDRLQAAEEPGAARSHRSRATGLGQVKSSRSD